MQKSTEAAIFDPACLKQLACPVCFGELLLGAAGEQIRCEGCGRAYPLIDGIPVLIPERAIQAS
jgi:uncharacterized protein YbaR (Trm112 family)